MDLALLTSSSDEDEDIGGLDSTSSGSAGESCLLDQQQDSEIAILCELVGARNLTIPNIQDAGDLNVESLRPFCIVNFGSRVVHTTSVPDILGPHPIWTATSQSLFVLKADPKEMSENVLTISIYSKREKSFPVRLKRNSQRLFLGQVQLDSKEILCHCDQNRFEVPIEAELGDESSMLGTLALRFRPATDSDQQIAQFFNRTSILSDKTKSQQAFKTLALESCRSEFFDKPQIRPQATLVTETNEAKVMRSSLMNSLGRMFSSKSILDTETGGQKVKIKPYPDPARKDETTFMSPTEIHDETRLPSHSWIEAGSGTLGKLYCEILACHDLPNVDIGEAVGNVTDPFVCLVYEDSCAMTEVIDDELSPHWLPWTQRAFSFGMMHPASILYVGVFDYDLGTRHEPIGRIAVNVSNLQRNTIHTLKYNLYPSSNVTDRTAVGSITIRVRIECTDEKAALLTALKPRPKIFVNVKKPKSFQVIRYTCFGQFDGEEKFDMAVTRSYINEVFEYKAALGYAICDSFTSLMFWRGQVAIFSVMTPLYSFVFFFMAIDLVERPQMIVSYSLLCVAWVMLATLTIRRQHPSPWNTCPSVWHYLHILSTGKAPTPVSMIKEYEGATEAMAYENAWKARLEEDQLVAAHQFKLQEELNELGDANMSTKIPLKGVIPLDILARLTRWQGIAGTYCGYFRFIKIIVTWEESVVSFWITAIFLTSGLLSLVLPWGFILKWTGRIVVWGFLGPHMKLVDLYFQANREKDGKLKQLVQKFDVQSNILRLRREEALKTKDFKAIAFGEYSTQIPSFNIARHFDRPLPESSARLCRSKPERGATRRTSVVCLNNSPWIPGQQLFGVMIPRPEVEALVHKQLFSRQEVKLKKFKSLVKSVNKSNAKATAEKRGLTLTRLGLDSDFPLAYGFEVVHMFDNCDASCASEPQEKPETRKILVYLTKSNNNTADLHVEEKLLLETDGVSTYEVKFLDAHAEEEGLELVGLGRYRTLSQDFAEEVLSTGSSDTLFPELDSLISLLYKSSEKIDIAFCLPPDEDTIEVEGNAVASVFDCID